MSECQTYLGKTLATHQLATHLAPRPSAEQTKPGLHTEKTDLNTEKIEITQRQRAQAVWQEQSAREIKLSHCTITDHHTHLRDPSPLFQSLVHSVGLLPFPSLTPSRVMTIHGKYSSWSCRKDKSRLTNWMHSRCTRRVITININSQATQGFLLLTASSTKY